ncbi:MAG: dienelactone hydrolase family protein [Pseudonocardia sp.]
MATIAVFHSVLGVRPGVRDAAQRLRAAGHDVHVVDQYGGRVFDDYAEAAAFVEEIGSFPTLMAAAVDGVAQLPDGLLCLGFSNGGGMAEHVAMQRPVAGVVLCSGALPLEMLGADAWPARVPVQIHYAVDDPFRQEGWAESVADAARAAGGEVEQLDYPGAGHLFTDASLPAEYDAASAELLWNRVLAFCARHG